MSDYKKTIDSQFKQFDSKYAKNKYLQQLEERTNIPKSYLVAGLAGIYIFMIFINPGGIGGMLSNFSGFVLPAYYSLVALKTPGGRDDSLLLIYWVIFSFFSVIEFWSSCLLKVIPFYWLLKTAFLFYIAVPSTGGARIIYAKVIDPATSRFLENTSKTNSVSASASNAAHSAASKVTSAGSHIGAAASSMKKPDGISAVKSAAVSATNKTSDGFAAAAQKATDVYDQAKSKSSGLGDAITSGISSHS
ncbi:hypothetical protein TBLA_0F01490 [Henningerozyma blattae CBS 6284]|uniref:Protein YOP1 n=1 Tax=Henningerozyma blattae (strain ATCC 34711 / CBS 6284 / DSM 70876 / NBRC 10599 / NRRL Y-10934 / UCD 77-7) TaxID=1071380 RepID=I2H5P0_HENB6|nr:hypothetical protein TBLA_0F01490 [Tetrapisispora blattae CBS 6284]CCH61692.1 hypothetical protein TBLA_0F01490 [Tetrapisispora blattae CBS 6284]